MRDGSVDLLPGLPTTTGLDATGRITGRFFQATAGHGVMDLGDGRRLNGADLVFTVPDTAPAPRVPANGGGHITGSADALADLLGRDALKRYVGVSLDPAAIHGQFQGELKLDLTMGKGVQPEEQKFRATGSLSGSPSTSSSAIRNWSRRRRLRFRSHADQDDRNRHGVRRPAKLEVNKVGQDVGALVVTGALDEAARARLGFGRARASRGPFC